MTHRERISDLLQISDVALLDELEQASRIKMVRKGEILQELGEKSRQTAFVIHGLFRGFYVDGKGVDVTDCFSYDPGNVLVSCAGIDEPSTISIEALEDGEVLCIQTDMFLQSVERSRELSKRYNAMLKEQLKMHWENKVALANRTAASRYRWFQERFPGLIDRVSHKHVASFLGMTPVSLSRVRKNMRDQ